MIEDKIYRLNELYYEKHIGDDYTWFLLENAKKIFRYCKLYELNEKSKNILYNSWDENLNNEIEKNEKILRKS